MLSFLKYKIIYENLQLADKYYFKSGLLNDKDKKIILDITNKDKFTVLIAALYKTLKYDTVEIMDSDIKMLNQFHEYLKDYNNKSFPLPFKDLNDVINSDKYNMIDLYTMLKDRAEIIRIYKSLPSIAKRNLKINYFNRKFKDRLFEINTLLDELKFKIDDDKYNNILKKVFTSKDNIDTVIDKLESFNDSLINITLIDKDEVINFAEFYELKYFKYFGDSVIVVQIEDQEQMKEIAGFTLWCFARPMACDLWDEYTNNSTDLPLLIFNFNYDYSNVNFLMLYLTKDDSFVNANNIYIQDDSNIDEQTVKALELAFKKI